MLKAMYDFQANYPKTISFDEGEFFILHQASVRQRNWWQVISMKGNIGFVPSNYVTNLKVSLMWMDDIISLYLFMDVPPSADMIPWSFIGIAPPSCIIDHDLIHYACSRVLHRWNRTSSSVSWTRALNR